MRFSFITKAGIFAPRCCFELRSKKAASAQIYLPESRRFVMKPYDLKLETDFEFGHTERMDCQSGVILQAGIRMFLFPEGE